MKFYRSAVLAALLILSTPGVYSFDATQVWGWPKDTDFTISADIEQSKIEGKLVYYNATIKMPYKINCVKFWDKTMCGARVWMQKEPPFYKSKFYITSERGYGLKFKIEVFHEGV